MDIAVFSPSGERPKDDTNRVIHLGAIMKKLVAMDEKDLAIVRAQVDPEYKESSGVCKTCEGNGFIWRTLYGDGFEQTARHPCPECRAAQ
jgi:hypothetical protein